MKALLKNPYKSKNDLLIDLNESFLPDEFSKEKIKPKDVAIPFGISDD